MKTFTYKPVGMNALAREFAPDKGLFSEVADLADFDPDKQGGLRYRPGRSLVMAGSDVHSGWSDGKQAYFVEGTALKRFFPGGLSSLVRLGLTPGLEMGFGSVNDVVVYGNGIERGTIVNGEDSVSFVPTDPFKFPMVPGYLFDFFNGRLYAAYGKSVYCSDTLDVPGGIESMDERFNVVMNFATAPTLLQGVTGGLYVSDEHETFFLPGADQQVEPFGQRLVAPYPAIKGTAVKVQSSWLGLDGGEACLWASTRGACLGLANGQMLNLSEDKVLFPPGLTGSAVIRHKDGNIHYFTVQRGLRGAANTLESR